MKLYALTVADVDVFKSDFEPSMCSGTYVWISEDTLVYTSNHNPFWLGELDFDELSNYMPFQISQADLQINY